MDTSRYAVNCSILLADRPIPDRLAAVKRAGIEAVEFWWPFATAMPDDAEVDSFIAAVRASGLRLVGLNLFAGDMPAGDRGIASWPGREKELLASARIAARIGDELGCPAFNTLYGNRLDGVRTDEQDALAERNLREVADVLAEIGGTVLVEPVSGADAYPLKSADDAVAVIERVGGAGAGPSNLGLLLDVYHLSVNGDDVPAAIERHRSRIAHVQIADAPGRGFPGSGDLPLRTWIDDITAGGYGGWIALEYSSDDADPLGWLAHGNDDGRNLR
ncbi:hydroxypyruvate isomerase family protein [Phytoactinopolyspora halotolerans]|uniref:TIM barrel protein n=1 Tax=Phytoactinopolyspora halotolerans TaxID=1981512 RepID=A0A6L9S4I2_9ACTN|nr:TIM barrel protein [Phytoactinopolyspora halotolerans]NED99906.1 TIM barrel protein [Phytoactinopolyspora halotolerans]